MGDMAEDFRLLRELRKKGKEARTERNRRILAGTKLTFHDRNGGSVMLLRDKDFPHADFYPGTNSWRAIGQTFRGDATEFLKWLQDQA